MEKAVDVAEKNMSRFGLSQAEISSRRKWVLQTRKRVSALCLHEPRTPAYSVPFYRSKGASDFVPKSCLDCCA